MPDTAPLVRTLEEDVAATAAGTDDTFTIGEAPFAGTVTSASFVANATLTGADTDSRTLNVVNKGQAGAGSTVVASKAFTNGVNATAFDETALTLSGTAANLVVAAGDILQLHSDSIGGTGLAQPDGQVRVEITRS